MENGYIEHGTEHERITAWQTILIKLDEKLPVADLMPHLKKHYKINANWDEVFAFWKTTEFAHSTDKMFEADKRFRIEVNKCKCGIKKKRSVRFPRPVVYDVNGMCKKCGLKMKK